ncbi:MAG TPA: amino acid adenylation domain-containing protein, partial [Ktedonobacteraceae bacterium]|nr:amino acid adenylation domain-containing protein [Ktedonobacteraceae bacterium]
MQTAGLKGSRLSLQQARLWSWQRESQVYHAQCAILLQGELDRDTLKKAFQDVVSRHEILRTFFHVVPGMELPMQVVAAPAELSYPTINIEGLNEQDQASLLNKYLAAAQEEPFDLVHGPLLRIVLLRLAECKHVLLLNLPALCADASTLPHLVAEICQAYSACSQAEDISDDPLQYADVSAWQDELLQDEDARLHREYWHRVDLSELATLRLPFERVLKEKTWEQGRCFASQRLEVPIESALSAQMQTLAQQMGVTVEVFLLTCWQILLWRLTGEPSCVVGVACDGRHYEELATALGLYTRFVPIDARFDKDQPFERVVTQVSTSLQEAIARQTYFTWELPEGAASDNQQPGFFPVSFAFAPWPSGWTAGELTFSLLKCACYQEPFALQLSVLQVGQTLRLDLDFDPGRMPAAAVERVAKHLHTLLHSACNQRQALVGRLPLLDPSERQYLLHTFSHTSASVPSQTLSQRFEAQVERNPSQLAVVAGGEQLTYQQLNTRANQVARALRRYGVGPDVLVGLCMERSVDMLVGLLAILKAGGAYVPLDIEHPPARLAYQLTDVHAPLLLTQEGLLTRIPAWEGQVLCLDSQQPSWWAAESEDNLEGLNGPEDVAYVIYTSGSTGVPKGVLIRHASVSNYTHYMCGLIAREPGLHFATVSTLAADLGNTAIFCALASGGCLHVLSYETVTSGQAFADYMAQHPLDVLKIVPSHLSALLSASNAGRALLPRRHLVLGGEAFTVELLKQLRELGGSCCVLNHYGPTEMTVGALVNVLGAGEELEHLETRESETVPIGRPIANTEAYVLDRYQQVVPVGVTGELYLGGAGLAVGYIHQEQQTRERFVAHPFRTEEGVRLYKTGDLVRYTEQGQIEFVGRKDGQVKLRGYRIELGEVEAALRRHDNVRDCVVILRKEETGTERLVAYVVARQQPTPTSQELRRFVGEQVPEYMVPSALVFLRVLPLTVNGKLDRQRLPVPEQDERDFSPTYVRPRSPIEEILVEIWAEVLMIGQVGIHDNFFRLGGHSLLATQIIARVQSVLQVNLPILSLFEAPTVAGLAERVEQALHSEQRVEVPPLVPTSRVPDPPLSFAQQRLWFLDQLEPGRATYNIP